MQKDNFKVNTDLRDRFVRKRTLVLEMIKAQSDVWISDIITRGDWIAVCNNGQFYVGLVLNFQKRNGRTKKEKTFGDDFVERNNNHHQNVAIQLEPVYRICSKKLVEKDKNLNFEYHSISSYINHLSSNTLDFAVVLPKITKNYMNSLRNQ